MIDLDAKARMSRKCPASNKCSKFPTKTLTNNVLLSFKNKVVKIHEMSWYLWITVIQG